MGWTRDEGELLSLIFLHLLCDFVGICVRERGGGGGWGVFKTGADRETHRQR